MVDEEDETVLVVLWRDASHIRERLRKEEERLGPERRITEGALVAAGPASPADAEDLKHPICALDRRCDRSRKKECEVLTRQHQEGRHGGQKASDK